MKPIFSGCLAAALLFFSACAKDENTPDGDDPIGPQEGYVTGKVTDSQGRGMGGVQVYFDHTLYFNSGFLVTTKSDGTYSAKIPDVGPFRGYAEISHTYNDRVFEIDLHPDNYDSFTDEGAVRNFSWKLTGEKPSNPGAFYGGTINVFSDPDSDISDRENVEFTLTPVGGLIDGSQGQTLVRKCGAPFTEFFSKVHDVPLGRYEVTAVHLPTGKQLKLREKYPEPYGEKLQLDFYGEFSPFSCSDCTNIEFTEK